MIKFYKYKNILSTGNQLQKNDFDDIVEKFEIWLQRNPTGGTFEAEGKKFIVSKNKI
jgi:hypothetical protein